jgi:hypothetical protein
LSIESIHPQKTVVNSTKKLESAIKPSRMVLKWKKRVKSLMCERGKVESGETIIIIVESLGGDNTTEDVRMSKEMIATEMIK